MKRIIVVWTILFAILLGFAYLLSPFQPKKESQAVQTVAKKTQPAKTEQTKSFTFMGVGDNLIHGAIWYYQQQAGQAFNFDENYANILPYTKKADLAYINFETIAASTDHSTLSSYPMFNGPVEINDAVVKAGFNWMSLASNHSLDAGVDGILKEHEYMKKLDPNMTITGSYPSEQASQKPVVKTVNGIKVGLATYTYGLNGMSLDADHQWMINLIDEDKIKKDIEALNKVSDVQIVSMHWGDEYSNGLNEQQESIAKLLNELGVEVIIGTHPHVIEPATWIHSKKQDTLCYYSLGNFLSAQDVNDRMIGGMATFKLTYDFNKKKATITNAEFTPTVTYASSDWKTINVNTIHEWDDQKAASSYVTINEGQPLTMDYIQSYVTSVMGQPKNIKINI